LEDQYTISEAKNRLSALVHSLGKGPIVKLTRHGRPVAVLISIQEYERLVQKKEGFWAALTDFRRQANVQQFEISDKDFEDLRDDSCGRVFEWS
jgi:prevent-host-death family protein